ncbi:unnamed protein product [Euphydryas editha]|uniref:Uncharacterized protein n=1 Tax=Euphydryas editha TaxID=104508 RepID=A0AAU9V3B1_EUPED|nr:unnamed protein product [Euphydryas editha]
MRPGAEAQVPLPPRSAPRPHWPEPRAPHRLGTAHVRGLPAATWPPLTGSAYKPRSSLTAPLRVPDVDENTRTSLTSRARKHCYDSDAE